MGIRKMSALFAVSVGLAWGASAQATSVMTYDGTVKRDLNGGGSFSYIHRATHNTVNPNGNHKQKAGGDVFLGFQQNTPFTFSVIDSSILRFDAVTFDVFATDGTIDNNNPPPLTDKVGTMTIGGDLNIDPFAPHSDEFDAGISGSLSYAIELTENVNIDGRIWGPHNGTNVNIEGNFYVQAADFGGLFNGYSEDGNMASFSFWADNRPPNGNSLAWPDGTIQGYRWSSYYHKWYYKDWDDYGLGIDFVAMGEKVPPPPPSIPLPPAAFAGMAMLAAMSTVRSAKRLRRRFRDV